MIENLPGYISIVFIATTLLCVTYLLYTFKQVPQSSKIIIFTLIAISLWMTTQAVLALNHFYLELNTIPPRFILAVGPPLIVIIALFILPSRKFILKLPLQTLMLIHLVRVPVELVLWWQFQQGNLPEVMTFTGRNFDILSGITAPIVWYFAFQSGKPKRTLLLIWNILALGLLLNIIVHAVLSTPYSFQQFGLEQPNKAVFYFPFIWLPSVLVPIVLFSNIVGIVQSIKLIKKEG